MNTKQHTPLPIGFATELAVNMRISGEQAEFIVRACNSHYELLEAAKIGEAIATAHFTTMKHDDPGKEKYIETVDKLRAAIAKAEGGAA